jgi:hypothetical protein
VICVEDTGPQLVITDTKWFSNELKSVQSANQSVQLTPELIRALSSRGIMTRLQNDTTCEARLAWTPNLPSSPLLPWVSSYALVHVLRQSVYSYRQGLTVEIFR